MNNILLSIIIPVYNVEDYLQECLNSVFIQDLSACEVICVNDGSTDGSRDIIQEFKNKNPDLIVIGGGISQVGEILFNTIEKTIKERAMKILTKNLKVVPASLGVDAGIISASALIFQKWE